jgi:hypothetical protein
MDMSLALKAEVAHLTLISSNSARPLGRTRNFREKGSMLADILLGYAPYSCRVPFQSELLDLSLEQIICCPMHPLRSFWEWIGHSLTPSQARPYLSGVE